MIRTRRASTLKLALAAFALIAGLLSIGAPRASQAHPLGNYSVNQYFLLDTRGQELELYYLLDLAEIPSMAELDLLDSDYNLIVSNADAQAYLDSRVPPLAKKITLAIDGANVPLKLASRHLSLAPGLADSAIFNIVLLMKPETPIAWPAAGQSMRIEVATGNTPREQGVREFKALLDGRFTNATDTLGDALKYQTLIAEDDQSNPTYQDFDAQFLLALAPGNGRVLDDAQRGAAFGWTASARAAADGSVWSDPALSLPEPNAAEITLAPGTPIQLGEGIGAAPGVRTRPAAFDEFTRPSDGAEGWQGTLIDRVTGIVRTKGGGTAALFAGLGIAFLLGMGHAFSPGHGKTVMAAYLIGERGTVMNAVVLGIVVTITHTWSVLLLGLITLYFQDRISQDSLNFWLSLLSGAIIVAIGALLFLKRYATYIRAATPRNAGVPPAPGSAGVPPAFGSAATHDHGHSHGQHGHDHAHDHGRPHDQSHDHPHDHSHDHPHDHDHDHPHEHSHDHPHPIHDVHHVHKVHSHTHAGLSNWLEHDHAHPHDHGHTHDHGHAHDHSHAHTHGDHGHSHVVRDSSGAPAGYWNILWLGISGGIVPCPAALIVLLLAISLGRLAYGLGLILTFSFGLALVLVGIGVAIVRASKIIRKFTGGGAVLRLLPVLSSVMIVALGSALLLVTLDQYKILVWMPGR